MKVILGLLLLMSWSLSPTLGAAQNTIKGLKFIETADGHQSKSTREVVQWTHSRMVFNKPLERVAVGQDAILQVEVLNGNEVLALAKKVGRTSIMVWYSDKTSETFLFSVVEDLSVLRRALVDIHPGVRLTLAPDREALILRGRVPTIKYRLAAEAAARHYLDAGQGSLNAGVMLQTQADIPTNLSSALAALNANPLLRLKQDKRAGSAKRGSSAAIINLIQVEQLPLDLTEKVRKAIKNLGGQSVTVSRIQLGDMPSDEVDTLLLGGQVETQVDLVRVLNLAARLFTGDYVDASKNTGMNILANESGGLLAGAQKTRAANQGGFGQQTQSGGLSGNNLRSNIGRAKLLSLAGGRLLSTIEVRDLPQVRVAVQMYEVNRRSLKQWRPDFSVVTKGYDKSGGIFGLEGANSRAAGASQVENAMQVLGGALVNNFQVGTSEVAFDLLFSMLEQAGISRTLSRPNLTVLAGESAVFRAGGEVPIPTAYAASGVTSDAGGAAGVFSGTQFKSFGVQLEVRAMVDENDRITLDLSPTISMPDTLLTQQIAGSTGSALNSAAFNVRSLNTSTRLRDGQPLIIGGLVSRDTSDNRDFVPGANRVPLLGKLAESSSDSDNERELIIIVTPTLVREARHELALWQFPSTSQLMQSQRTRTQLAR